MITLDLARKLRDAGLVWEPKPKDDFAYESGKVSWLYEYYPAVFDYPKRFVWLPSLSQLLAEIEGRGYYWEMSPALLKPQPRYEIVIYDHRVKYSKSIVFSTVTTTREEAAGLALLHILGGERDA